MADVGGWGGDRFPAASECERINRGLRGLHRHLVGLSLNLSPPSPPQKTPTNSNQQAGAAPLQASRAFKGVCLCLPVQQRLTNERWNRSQEACLHRGGSELPEVGGGGARLDLPHHAAECSSGLEQGAGPLPGFFFFSLSLSSFCLQDTIASFNILYLAPAKRGDGRGEEGRPPHIRNSSFI